jgi:hypothetical protein
LLELRWVGDEVDGDEVGVPHSKCDIKIKKFFLPFYILFPGVKFCLWPKIFDLDLKFYQK